ncbi:MAG: AraC family transcriptional regulator [Clostridia bacterium]|nr:AraC family transcriptional regulator [Clostridia bacterium]
MKKVKSVKEFDISLRNCGKDRYIAKGHVFGPIISGDYIMQYCFAGCGVFKVDGKSFPVKKGECMVTFPGQQRIETADEETPWRHIWLSFEGESARRFFSLLGTKNENPVISFFGHSKIPYLMESIIELSENTEPGGEFILASKLYEFLDECIKARSNNEGSLKAKDMYVSHAINYLELHFTEFDIRVEKLAEHIGIDRSYFYGIFKEITGVSPKEYLTELRMKKASELLKIPGATVTNVAYSVGYEPSVFTKAFKNYYGINPSECIEKTVKGDGIYG